MVQTLQHVTNYPRTFSNSLHSAVSVPRVQGMSLSICVRARDSKHSVARHRIAPSAQPVATDTRPPQRTHRTPVVSHQTRIAHATPGGCPRSALSPASTAPSTQSPHSSTVCATSGSRRTWPSSSAAFVSIVRCLPRLDQVGIQMVHYTPVVIVPPHLYEFPAHLIVSQWWVPAGRTWPVQCACFPSGVRRNRNP